MAHTSVGIPSYVAWGNHDLSNSFILVPLENFEKRFQFNQFWVNEFPALLTKRFFTCVIQISNHPFPLRLRLFYINFVFAIRKRSWRRRKRRRKSREGKKRGKRDTRRVRFERKKQLQMNRVKGI
jgi:hypothetical protein